MMEEPEKLAASSSFRQEEAAQSCKAEPGKSWERPFAWRERNLVFSVAHTTEAVEAVVAFVLL